MHGMPAVGLDRARLLRHGRSQRARVRRLRPRGVDRLRVRDRARAHRHAPPRPARDRTALAERSPPVAAILMKVPVSWLREYVEVSATTRQIADRLAIATGEAERITRRGVEDENGNYGLFRVGRVVEAGMHPNADRLQLCRVDVGEGEPRQIVCGAWNFGAGATVAVALPGAVLPDGNRLERAKLRGELSDGMILSERELELGGDHSGILVLGDPAAPGTPLAEVLPLGEELWEIEMTRNRPDCLSVYGIAREVAALFSGELAPPPGRDPGDPGPDTPDVSIEDYEGCPRYIGRLFKN